MFGAPLVHGERRTARQGFDARWGALRTRRSYSKEAGVSRTFIRAVRAVLLGPVFVDGGEAELGFAEPWLVYVKNVLADVSSAEVVALDRRHQMLAQALGVLGIDLCPDTLVLVPVLAQHQLQQVENEQWQVAECWADVVPDLSRVVHPRRLVELVLRQPPVQQRAERGFRARHLQRISLGLEASSDLLSFLPRLALRALVAGLLDRHRVLEHNSLACGRVLPSGNTYAQGISPAFYVASAASRHSRTLATLVPTAVPKDQQRKTGKDLEKQKTAWSQAVSVSAPEGIRTPNLLLFAQVRQAWGSWPLSWEFAVAVSVVVCHERWASAGRMCNESSMLLPAKCPARWGRGWRLMLALSEQVTHNSREGA